MDHCKGYCGLSCISIKCNEQCEDCVFNVGCAECVLFNTDLCINNLER